MVSKMHLKNHTDMLKDYFARTCLDILKFLPFGGKLPFVRGQFPTGAIGAAVDDPS